jgi:ABC-type uncharacterized transport system permease subunit
MSRGAPTRRRPLHAESEAPPRARRSRLSLRGWRIRRRPVPRPVAPYRVAAILVGGGVALALGPTVSSQDASSFYSTVWYSTFGTPLGFSDVLIVATPLLLTALAACVPYRLKLWNIGGDGQMYLGAWGAAAVAFSLGGKVGTLPLVTLMILASIVAGALWIAIPALARAYLGVSEIITTLLLNFAGLLWLIYWATGPWRDPLSAGGVQSESMPAETELPFLDVGGVFIPSTMIAAVLIAVLIWGVFKHTRWGYELTVLRESERAAHFAGIGARARIVAVMLVGGALAGVAGATEMMGNTFHYSDAISNETGYAGIIVAILAGGSELLCIPVAVLFAAIVVAGNTLSGSGIESDLVVAVLGLMLFAAALGDGFARLALERRAEE